MNEDNAQVIYDLLDRIKVTDENRERIENIRKYLGESKFQEALEELQILQASGNIEYIERAKNKRKKKRGRIRISNPANGHRIREEIYRITSKWCKADICILFYTKRMLFSR